MKRISYFIIASLIVLFTASCSSEKAKEKKAEEAAEEFVENLLETASDNMNIDIDEDNSEVTIEVGDGTEISTKVGKEIPSDFPDDVYLIKGEIEASMKTESNQGDLFTVAINLDKSVTEAANEIKKEMTAKGWTSTLNMNAGDGASQMYMKGKNSANVTITTEDGKTVAAYLVTVTK